MQTAHGSAATEPQDQTYPLQRPRVTVTSWASTKATEPEWERRMPWTLFVEWLRRRPPVREKTAAPVVTLARFGEHRSSGVSLRNDENVVEVTAAPGDLDGGELTLDETVCRLQAHDVLAVVATTFQHEPESPRLRVFAPLRSGHPPDRLNRFVAALEKALGATLDSSSFTVSQQWYVGGREGGPRYEVVDTEGSRCIDEVADELLALDSASRNGKPGEVDGGPIAEGHRNTTLTRMAGGWRWAGAEEDELLARLHEVNAERCDPPLADRELETIARSVCRYAPGEERRYTDTDNAHRFLALHGHRLRYVPDWNRWLVGDPGDGFWTVDNKQAVRTRELAKDVGRRLRAEALKALKHASKRSDRKGPNKKLHWAIQTLQSGRISGLVSLARGVDRVLLDHERLDADAWLLGVGNGVVDLRTGEHRQARLADLLSRRSPVEWKGPEAPAERWRRALEEWFPHAEVRDYVQRLAGAALVGEQRDHLLVIHYGQGANGKGTFLRALQHVLGPYAVEVHLSLLVQDGRQEHDTVKADLFRTRLAVAVETERRVQLAEASVKNLTGGDRIRARRMREDPWSFDPSHSLWLQTNHLPAIRGRDLGIWRRIRVVEWTNAFTGHQADPELDEKLRAEASGVLAWLVRGCLTWQERGLAEPEAVRRATDRYRDAEDVLARFARETGLCIEPANAERRVPPGEVVRTLEAWARNEGLADRTQRLVQDLAGWLEDQGVEKARMTVDGKRGRYWIGAAFVDEDGDDGNPTWRLDEDGSPDF